MSENRTVRTIPSLTGREIEVLRQIEAGYSNKAIAEQLDLSCSTVAWYVRQIFNKLGVDRRTQALAAARSLGILAGKPETVPERPLLALTNREIEVLRLIDSGLSNREIAKKLTISYHTVTWHVRQIFKKLKVSRRTQALSVARSLHILDNVRVTEKHHNLPAQLTSFIGRECEFAKILEELGDPHCRLVTITGSGGIGKTQLSLQAGRSLFNRFPDGVWLAELASISNAAFLPQSVANALGLWESASQPILDILLGYLHEKQLLIILDNCEHLIDGAAHFAETVLEACPAVKILASSRETLGLAGEVSFQVPPLSFPQPQEAIALENWKQYDALRLFAERAQAVFPGFQVNQDNLQPIVKICQCLDGIPLAIEMAVARVKLLPVEEIASRLDERFRLLTKGSRTAHPRQQTLRATVDWSWALLSAVEQDLMRLMSVFSGGMSLEAVEEVCGGDGIDPGEVLDLLNQLVSKSMLVARREQGQKTRYRLLETIRQYALEQLEAVGLDRKYRNRHLHYFTQLAAQAEVALFGPEQVAWLFRLEQELDNIRAALEWALESDVDAGLHLSTAILPFWEQSYVQMGEAWISKLLACAGQVEPAIRARALWSQGRLNIFLQRLDSAQSLLEKSMALYRAAGDQQGTARCLSHLGWILNAGAHPFLFESLSLLRELDDPLGLAQALQWLGFFQGKENFEKGMAYLMESDSLYREMGHLLGIIATANFAGNIAVYHGEFETARSWVEVILAFQASMPIRFSKAALPGSVYFRLGEYDRAREYLEEILSIFHKAGDKISTIWLSVVLGHILVRVGELDEAQVLLTECQQQFSQVGQITGSVYSIEGLASLAVIQGKAEKAARLIGWADATRQSTQDFRPPIEQTDVDRDIASIIEEIGHEAFSSAYTEGQGMTMEQAVYLTTIN